MITDTPFCPGCSQRMKDGGLAVFKREDDGRRVCRSLWKCTHRHVWWKWADRPDEPWEACPWPQLFR
ncbi:dehydrogenase [Streptomyces sp. NPDC002574]|uniref:dehydrogenase n=1 Tax=Streptomyces sp. NPDC002574 TaxID=3364652 RepID=UPI0036A3680E